MARIQGIDLPKNKRGVIALTYIFGIGKSFAKNILDKANISHDKKVQDWTDEESNMIRTIIGDNYTVEGELRAEIKTSIKRLMDIGCYRGIRHRTGLPLRGQKTKTIQEQEKEKEKQLLIKKVATK